MQHQATQDLQEEEGVVHTTCPVSIELSLLFPVHQLNVWKFTSYRFLFRLNDGCHIWCGIWWSIGREEEV